MANDKPVQNGRNMGDEVWATNFVAFISLLFQAIVALSFTSFYPIPYIDGSIRVRKKLSEKLLLMSFSLGPSVLEPKQMANEEKIMQKMKKIKFKIVY